MNHAPLTHDTLGVIRRNAGRVPKAEIAKSLGWNESYLERVARDHGYDLRMVVDRPAGEQPHPITRSRAVREPLRRGPARRHPAHLRSEQVSFAMMPSDLALIEATANAFGLKRAAVLGRIIENARARGLIEDLARLPAPMPEPTGNLDEESI